MPDGTMRDIKFPQRKYLNHLELAKSILGAIKSSLTAEDLESLNKNNEVLVPSFYNTKEQERYMQRSQIAPLEPFRKLDDLVNPSTYHAVALTRGQNVFLIGFKSQKEQKQMLRIFPSSKLYQWQGAVAHDVKDLAMKVDEHNNTGGIDLSPAYLNVQSQYSGEEIKFHIDTAMLAELRNSSGFTPDITDIEPLADVPKFLGISNNNSSKTSLYQPEADPP